MSGGDGPLAPRNAALPDYGGDATRLRTASLDGRTFFEELPLCGECWGDPCVCDRLLEVRLRRLSRGAFDRLRALVCAAWTPDPLELERRRQRRAQRRARR